MGQWSTVSALVPFRQELPFLGWKKRLARQRWKSVAIVIHSRWAHRHSLRGAATSMCIRSSLGIGKGLSLLEMFFPPDWSGFMGMLQPTAVTAVMALSLPCSACAFRFLARWLHLLTLRRPWCARSCARLLPSSAPFLDTLQMLLLIAIFGLGAVPGLIALAATDRHARQAARRCHRGD